MPATKLEEHSSSLIFKAMQAMIIAQGFTWNDDISDTDIGTANNKEFKLIAAEVENSDRSNRQNFRVTGTFEIMLVHNAEGRTDNAQVRALEDAENIVFDIERFAPDKFTEAKPLVSLSRFLRWTISPIKGGDDSKIRTVIFFDITYIIKNPNVI